jgi:hypothetical protein
MGFWWTDRALPGLASSAIWAVVLWVSHHRLRRHVDRITEQQTRRIEKLTLQQTAELRGQEAAGERHP